MTPKTRRPPSTPIPVAFPGRPLVAGITPGQPSVVALSAVGLAEALDVRVYFAYVDPARYTVEEYPDGTVHHEAVEPDAATDWQSTETQLHADLTQLLAGRGVPWELRYLAGMPWRALTHLARAVDASMFVVGSRRGPATTVRGFLDASVGARLAHHQHRPVMAIPIDPVDWHGRTPWQ